MFLHITHDDKFIDRFIEVANKCTNKDQKFVIYTTNPEYKLIHVKSQNVLPTHLYTDKFWQTIGDLSQYSTIYIHYLSLELLDFIKSIPRQVKVVWIFWGADAFDLPGLKESTYLDLTRSIVDRSNKLNVWGIAKRFYSDKKLLYKFKEAVARIDYFAHYIPEDYLKIKNFLNAGFEFIDFTYGTVEQYIFPGSVTSEVQTFDKVNILIGNSANPANNHLDAIDILSKVNLPNTKIYMPLSYSGTPEYIKTVTSKGYDSFGDEFVPLIDFMPVEEYYGILNSVGYAIMPHKRSQAWGNIIALLWHGVKIYMSSESSLFLMLEKLGIKVYSLKDISSESISLPLEEFEIESNKFILKKHFGENYNIKRYYALLSL